MAEFEEYDGYGDDPAHSPPGFDNILEHQGAEIVVLFALGPEGLYHYERPNAEGLLFPSASVRTLRDRLGLGYDEASCSEALAQVLLDDIGATSSRPDGHWDAELDGSARVHRVGGREYYFVFVPYACIPSHSGLVQGKLEDIRELSITLGVPDVITSVVEHFCSIHG